jgi:hypothetical protein
VWQREHPAVRLTPRNMSAEVTRMVDAARGALAVESATPTTTDVAVASDEAAPGATPR